jgi:hypothetical protein
VTTELFVPALLLAAVVGIVLIRIAVRRATQELADQSTDARVYDDDAPVGRICVRRNGGRRTDRLRAYHVFVDGKRIGYVRPGENACFEVLSGERVVALGIDWARSNEVTVLVAAGGRYALYCEARATGKSALFWITLGRKRYLRLQLDASAEA